MKNALDIALETDIGQGDITSNALFSKSHRTTAVIIAKDQGMLAGTGEAVYVFRKCGASAKALKRDGAWIKRGDTVMRITGPARGVLCAERTALNIISRMSGIATATAKLAKTVAVAATRKSPPGMTLLDKKAVAIGGGLTHRLGLWDMTLIKDTHLDSISHDRTQAIREAMRKAKKPVEIEVNSTREALLAAKLGAGMVMLDNFSPAQAKKTVREMRKNYPEAIIEISGGVNQKNLRDFAEAKPDFISLGMLTAAAKPLDFSMKIAK